MQNAGVQSQSQSQMETRERNRFSGSWVSAGCQGAFSYSVGLGRLLVASGIKFVCGGDQSEQV